MNEFNSGISRATDIITGVARSLVALLIALVVLFAFATLLFGTITIDHKTFNVIKNIKVFVNHFLGGGFAGLLALIVFVGFLLHRKD